MRMLLENENIEQNVLIKLVRNNNGDVILKIDNYDILKMSINYSLFPEQKVQFRDVSFESAEKNKNVPWCVDNMGGLEIERVDSNIVT